ncbi:MAG TPA: hypothetical protein VGN37_18500 [Actinocatenispora sp.]
MPARLAATASYVRIDGTAPPITDRAGYLDRLIATQPVGTAGDVAERLAESVAVTGIRRVLLMVEGAGDPAATYENIAALGDQCSRLAQRRPMS